MSMQLFSFGHPCEHQLRRTCIGGTSCPLNGYPDAWCCSYIKGKINFKRDKPCEGPRCRWGFTHPSHQQFDEVTQVLNDSRPMATKIDEAEDTDVLSFHTESPHIVDTVQCALHMLRHPPSSCARRVGQLMAYGAVKAGDAKVFLQVLKTMKKPVDNYILGAFFYLTEGTPPNPVAGPTSTSTAAASAGKGGKKTKTDLPKKEDVVQELRNDLVDIMNAALSHAGHLVDREDQHLLQATFLQALRHYPKSNKRRQDMLEAATQCFGNRPPPKDVPAAPAASTSGADASAAPTTTTTTTTAASATGAGTQAAAAPTTTAPSTPGRGTGTPLTSAEATKARTSPALPAATVATLPSRSHSPPPSPPSPPSPPLLNTSRLPTLAEVAAAASGKAMVHHPAQASAAAPSSTAVAVSAPATAAETTAAPVASAPALTAPHLAPSSAQAAPTSAPQVPAHATSTTTATNVATTPSSRAAAMTISRIALLHAPVPRPLSYDPLRVDAPLPNVFLAGGLLALSPTSTGVAPLGAASVQVRPPTASTLPAGGPSSASRASGSGTSATMAAVASELQQTLFGLSEPVFEHFDAERMFTPGDDLLNA